jgi:hypothetical protein
MKTRRHSLGACCDACAQNGGTCGGNNTIWIIGGVALAIYLAFRR